MRREERKQTHFKSNLRDFSGKDAGLDSYIADTHKQVKWDNEQNILNDALAARQLQKFPPTRTAPKAHTAPLESTSDTVLGVNIASLARNIAALKHRWIGSLGSSFFPDKEQEGQVIFAFAVVAVYLLVKAVMGAGSPLVVAVGLFLFAGRLTRHPPGPAGAFAAADTSDPAEENDVVEFDMTALADPSAKTPLSLSSGQPASARSAPSVASVAKSNPRPKAKSLLEEAVEDLRRSHEASGLSTASRLVGRNAGDAAMRIARDVAKHSAAAKSSRASSEAVNDAESEQTMNAVLAQEFSHHRRPARGVQNGTNTIAELPPGALDEEKPAALPLSPSSAGAAARARRNRRSRVMRVQIKQRPEVPNFDNIILR